MILYVDTSALVKRYITERGAPEAKDAFESARIVGISLTTRAEMVAALAKAMRVGILERNVAEAARELFYGEWQSFVRLQVTEGIVQRGGVEAWNLGLRGYDAVHLASALIWQESMQEAVTFSTFDRRLWEAARQRGLQVLPSDLPDLLAHWNAESDAV